MTIILYTWTSDDNETSANDALSEHANDLSRELLVQLPRVGYPWHQKQDNNLSKIHSTFKISNFDMPKFLSTQISSIKFHLYYVMITLECKQI